jgi:nucleotide-binding universal stress UspA family protein
VHDRVLGTYGTQLSATAWIAVRSASTEAGGKPIKLPGKVTKLVEELSRDGLDAVAKVVSYVGPRPAQGIAEIAREAGADVIVVGTRGHSALGGLVVGSVARRLLHVAPCPVLTVPRITPPAELKE